MTAELKKKIDTYIDYLSTLQQNLEEKKDDLLAPRHTFHRIFRDPYPGLGRSLYKQYLSEQQGIFKSFLTEVKNFLQTVSIKNNNLPPKGNSARLLQRLAIIEGVVKLETKIRKTIVILTQIREENLIYNSQIYQYQEEQESAKLSEHQTIITNLEQALREFIKVKMMEVSYDWWRSRVPIRVRQEAELRKTHKKYYDLSMNKNDVIEYLYFVDYSKIITREKNWNDVFQKVFGDKDVISVKLKELNDIRREIMHSRRLSRKQIQRLNLNSSDLHDAMKNL